jgi:hypothetical protein
MSLATACAGIFCAAAGVPDSPALQAVIDAVVSKGSRSQLPAHLSIVLGLAHAEQGVPVRQAVMRDGAAIHTFNVSDGDHSQVVLLTYEAASQMTKAYRVSPTGRLQNAVAYRGADQASERGAREAQADFGKEIGFWTRFQRPVAKP